MRIVAAPLGGALVGWWFSANVHGGVDFLVTDGAGKALVKSQLARVSFQEDREASAELVQYATPALAAFLANRDHPDPFALGRRSWERLVEAGDTVRVLGLGHWERDPDEQASAGAGYRDAKVPRRLVMGSVGETPLLIRHTRPMKAP